MSASSRIILSQIHKHSWRHWCYVLLVFNILLFAVLIGRNALYMQYELITTQALGGDVRYTDNKPIVRDIDSKYRAQSVGLRTVVFINNMPLLIYLRGVSPQYPLSGKLAVNSGVPWSKLSFVDKKKLWIDNTLSNVYGLKSGQKLQLGHKNYEIGGVVNTHTVASQGFDVLLPSIITDAEQVLTSGLVRAGSQVLYEVFSDREHPLSQDEITKDVKQTTAKIDAENKQRWLLVVYDWLDLLMSIMGVWFLYSTAYAALYHKQCIQKDADVLSCLGYSRHRYYRLAFLLVSSSVCSVGLIFLAVMWSLGFGANIMGMYAVICFSLVMICGQMYMLGTQLYARICQFFLCLLSVLLMFKYWFSIDWILCLQLLSYGGIVFILIQMIIHFFLQFLKKTTALFLTTYRPILLLRVAIKMIIYRQIKTMGGWFSAIIVIAMLTFSSNIALSMQDLMEAMSWPSAPNLFVINILPEQVSLLKKTIGHETFYPMIKGRIIALDGHKVKDQKDRWVQEGALRRDLNLTYMSEIPSNNTVVAGSFSSESCSFESELAKRLGLKIGSKVTLNIYDEIVTCTVGSLRQVNWTHLTPNFFLIMPEAILKNKPTSYITSFHWNPKSTLSLTKTLQLFPQIQFIFIDAVIKLSRYWLNKMMSWGIWIMFFLVVYAVYHSRLILQTTAKFHQKDMSVLIMLGLRRGECALITAFKNVLLLLVASILGWIIGKCFAAMLLRNRFFMAMDLLSSADAVLCIALTLVAWIWGVMTWYRYRAL